MLVKTPDQRYHAYFDILIGLVFLILLNEAARRRKWSMERADQVSFVLALKQRKASRSMFQILTFMLPSFVVARILRSPGLSASERSVGMVTLVAAMVQAKSGADSIWAALDDTEIFEDAVVNAGHSRGSEWSCRVLCFCLPRHLIFILVLTFIETMYLADSLTPFEQKPQWHPVGIGKWTEEQCESLRFYEKQELYACKQLCWDYTTGHCTAIEFNEVSGDCTLRRCPPEDIPSMLLEDPATSCNSAY
eukprot:g15098.t1